MEHVQVSDCIIDDVATYLYMCRKTVVYIERVRTYHGGYLLDSSLVTVVYLGPSRQFLGYIHSHPTS